MRALYVALTRATKRLTLVHARPLPESLRRVGRRRSGRLTSVRPASLTPAWVRPRRSPSRTSRKRFATARGAASTSRSGSSPAGSWPCSARAGAARPRCCASSPGSSGPTPARWPSAAGSLSGPTHVRAARAAAGRHGVPGLGPVPAPDGGRERRPTDWPRGRPAGAGRAGAGHGRPRRSRRPQPATLSGGQQQRVALARALAPEPAVLLLDEPFSNLDTALRVQVRAEVRRLLGDLGVTTVFVTHDQEEAFVLGDEVAVMHDGRIVQQAVPADLYLRPVDALGRRLRRRRQPGRRARPTGGASTAVGRGARWRRRATGPARVLLRPEELRVERGDSATVEVLEYYGHDTVYLVRLDAGPAMRVRIGSMPAFRPGDRVRVATNGNPDHRPTPPGDRRHRRRPGGAGAAWRAATAGHEVTVVERRPTSAAWRRASRSPGSRVDHGSHRLHPSTEPSGPGCAAPAARRRPAGPTPPRTHPAVGRWVGVPAATPSDLVRGLPPRLAAGRGGRRRAGADSPAPRRHVRRGRAGRSRSDRRTRSTGRTSASCGTPTRRSCRESSPGAGSAPPRRSTSPAGWSRAPGPAAGRSSTRGGASAPSPRHWPERRSMPGLASSWAPPSPASISATPTGLA